MSDPDDQFRRDVARTRLYLMGDTGVGPEEDRVPLGLTRMSKIAMRRSAHLGEVSMRPPTRPLASYAGLPTWRSKAWTGRSSRPVRE